MNGPNPSPASQPLSLVEAAAALDVHYMTAYRYVRTGRMAAEKRAGQWWVLPEDLARVEAEGTGRRGRPAGSGIAREFLVEPFTARLVAGDATGCWNMVSSALAGGATPAEIHDRLLRAALVEVGDAWERGDLTVGGEHRATATAIRIVGQMSPLFRRRGRRRGSVVLGAVAGDFHALPSALVADLLVDRHFDVIDLGGNAPAESFVEIAEATDDLVGIGVCSALDALASQSLAQIEQMRAALPNAFIIVGGPAFMTSRARFEPLVDLVSSSAEEACAALESVLAAAPLDSTGSGDA